MTFSKSARAQGEDVELQRIYYANTAQEYDQMHFNQSEGHGFALQFMISVLEQLCIQSILDVGSGTGRALIRIRDKMPSISILGIEPSPELRSIGHAKGLPETQLIDGDGMNLAFADASFDLVCEFGALPRIPEAFKSNRGDAARCAQSHIHLGQQ